MWTYLIWSKIVLIFAISKLIFQISNFRWIFIPRSIFLLRFFTPCTPGVFCFFVHVNWEASLCLQLRIFNIIWYFLKFSKMILLKIFKIFFENETLFLHNCYQNTDSHFQSCNPVRPLHLFCVQSIWIHQDQMSKAGYISIGCPCLEPSWWNHAMGLPNPVQQSPFHKCCITNILHFFGGWYLYHNRLCHELPNRYHNLRTYICWNLIWTISEMLSKLTYLHYKLNFRTERIENPSLFLHANSQPHDFHSNGFLHIFIGLQKTHQKSLRSGSENPTSLSMYDIMYNVSF